MADPLTLLRQFNINKKDISEDDKYISFDAVSFLKTAKTSYIICRTTPKEYYTLEALLFLLKNVHLSHPIYVQRAGAAKVPVVRFPDRKDLLAFLNGDKETTQSIDKSAPLELPVQRTTSLSSKRPLQEGSSEGAKKARTEDGQARYDIQEWLALKLQDKKEGAVTTEKIRKEGKGGLNTVMSVEKIAEIKRKIITRKRGTIKGDDELESGMLEQAPMPPTAFTAIPDIETDVTKDIVMRERLLRTRTSVLQSSGKVFLKNVLAILQSVKAKEGGKVAQSKPEQPPLKKEVPELAKKPVPAASYSRYDQERFGSHIDKGGFKIDTSATFHGLSLESMKEGKSQRQVTQPTANSNPNKSPRHISSAQKPSGLPQKRESKTPIIIVPAGTTSLISLMNVKDFLQDYKFASPEDKKKSGVVKESEVLLQRKKDMVLNQQIQNVTVPLRVVDQPLKLSSNDWNRVVAVFVQGPLWQFKGWPAVLPDGSPVEILTKIKGFHVKYDDMKLDANVKKWDVEVLTVSRNRRHMDRACALKFWEILDKFMVKNKPNLRY